MSAPTPAAPRSRQFAPRGGGGLEIIGAGFGRTGTSSLQQALQILGYGPCYHMREVFKDPDGVAKWNAVGDLLREQGHAFGADELWDDIFRGYRSCCDAPAALVYRELMERYPNAKVILTVRDEEKWVESALGTISPVSPAWNLIYRITGLLNPEFLRMTLNVVWTPFCGGVAQARDRDCLLAAFRAHNDQVRAHVVPEEKLLVLDVQEGWASLCKFLDKPIPDVPFPRSWDSVQFKKMIAAKQKKAVTRLMMMGAGFVLTVVSVGFLTNQRRRWKIY